ncbi:MAG: IS4/IS5 family transposase, partial [bacterium]
MSYQNSAGSVQCFEVVRRLFLQSAGLPYSDVLSEETIQQAFADNDAEFGQGEDAVYTPALTLWVFLTQVLQTGVQRSCNVAVDRLRSLCLSLGISAPSPDSGAYCRARAKLPDNVLETLTVQVADELEDRIPEAWLWHGRHVVNVDGTTATAPDTPANQEAWPQQPGQKPGLGFPILRLCAL